MKRVLLTALACSTLVLGACSTQDDEREQLQDTQISAIIACMRNTEAYSYDLLGQCIDDWFEMRAEVDY